MILGIETGGTTIVCASADDPAEPLDVVSFPTGTPAQTLPRISEVVRRHDRRGLRAVGVGAFGPVGVDPASPSYGRLGATPKTGWQGVDLLHAVRSATGAPMVLDTDVTAAAVGEARFGAGTGMSDLAYVTVGTGVGLGAIVQGRRLHGTGHPEAGHLTVRRHPDDGFDGVCRLHGDCLEGLACGPAIERRWGARLPDVGPSTEQARALQMEAWYLAQLVTALVYVLAPQRIVLGGGVMQAPGLLAAVRVATADLLAGALLTHPADDPGSDYLVLPALGGRAGVIGALTMAADLLRAAGHPPPSRPAAS